MKRIALILLPMLAVVSFADTSLAEKKVTINSSEIDASQIVEISPHDLVTAGYQGRLAKNGIPSLGRFLNDVKANKIDAEDLVKVAIAQGRLPKTTQSDQSYLRRVNRILNNLDRN